MNILPKIRSNLKQLFRRREAFEFSVKTPLFENFRIKLVVITVATLFWFAVVTENEYSYELDIPIVVANLLPSKTLSRSLPARARVRFEGRGKALLALLFTRDAYLELDLANARNSVELELKPAMVHVPRRGLSVTPRQVIAPNTIALKLSNLHTRRVPLKPMIGVETQAGYTVVGDIQLEPDSITITGPEELVKKIASVPTQAWSAKEVRESLVREVKLQAFPDSTCITLPFDKTKVTVDVQKIIELNLQEIPVRVKNAPAHLNVTAVPSTLALTVEGGERLLINLKREELAAYIDFAHASDDEAQGHPVEILAPPGVRYRNVKPGLVQTHDGARQSCRFSPLKLPAMKPAPR
jgi:YbbR domain-containing protein